MHLLEAHGCVRINQRLNGFGDLDCDFLVSWINIDSPINSNTSRSSDFGVNVDARSSKQVLQKALDLYSKNETFIGLEQYLQLNFVISPMLI